MDSQTRKINIIEERKDNPCATLERIGAKYGVSRERVRQVLSEAGKPTSALVLYQTYICNYCGKDMGTTKRLFCDKQCWYDSTHIDIACSYCDKLSKYRVKKLIWDIDHNRHSADLFFCSKECQGKWLAANHGFGIHPENMSEKQLERKWDYDKIYQAKDETGFGGTKLSRFLGIPESTTYRILAKRRKDETQS